MNDLEQRYRALSRQFHPDFFYNAPAAERRASLEKSSYLNDAYRALKNPVTRIEYLLKLEQSAVGGRQSDGSPHVPGGGQTQATRGEGSAGLKTPPPGLLEEVFALNEELDEIREARSSGAPAEEWKARLERARKPIEAKREEHESQLADLSARWDAAADASEDEKRAILSALNERILERNYIANLLAGIERELAQ